MAFPTAALGERKEPGLVLIVFRTLNRSAVHLKQDGTFPVFCLFGGSALTFSAEEMYVFVVGHKWVVVGAVVMFCMYTFGLHRANKALFFSALSCVFHPARGRIFFSVQTYTQRLELCCWSNLLYPSVCVVVRCRGPSLSDLF